MKTKIPAFLLMAFGWVYAFAQDGKIDRSFADSGYIIENDSYFSKAFDVTTDKSGKIILAGRVGHSDDTIAVNRYNEDGSPDQSFGINGKVVTFIPNFTHSFAYGVCTDENNKILITGEAGEDLLIAQYRKNGSLDNSFGQNGIILINGGDFHSGYGNDIVLQNDGKILVTGSLEGIIAVLRLNTDGSPDATFGNGGKVLVNAGLDIGFGEEGNKLKIQPDNKIVILANGAYELGGFSALVRLTSSGELDNSFGINGIAKITGVDNHYVHLYDIALQNDGKIVAGSSITGRRNQEHFVMLRFLPNGQIDQDFSYKKTIVNLDKNTGNCTSVLLQNDGKIIGAGITRLKNYLTYFVMTRFLPNGTVDSSFNKNGTYSQKNFYCTATAFQADGKIITGGYFADLNSSFAVARFHNSNKDFISKKKSEVIDLKVFPNPASHFLSITGLEDSPVRMKIFTAEGLLKQTISSDILIEKINVQALPSGWYFLEVIQNGMKSSTKFYKY